jgi:fatty-acyl-CoA synthase
MVRWADATVIDMLDFAVESNPLGEAVVSGPERLTYQDLAAKVDDLARGFQRLGVRPGDRIALWMVNRPEWIITYFAAAKAGAILVAVNTRYATGECRQILQAAEPTVLVVQDEFRKHRYLESVTSICPEITDEGPGRWSSRAVPSLREVIVAGSARPRGARAFEEVLAGGRDETLAVHIEPDDTFLILFTSGTTARSKGVTLSHRNVVPNNYYSGERQQLGRQDRMLIVLPLSSAFSCVHALIAAVSHLGALVLLDSFSATACMRLIERERCTAMYGVDSIFQDLINAPDRGDYDLSSLRTGVGVLTTATAEAIHTELGVPDYHQGWGMTECGAVGTMTSVIDPVRTRLETVGTPLPGLELKIVDPDTGAAAADGALGEILLRGRSVTKGFYRDPASTAQVIDDDGWLHTSDLGQVLPGGYLSFRGRIKDTFKPNGFNVSPLEVEEVICSLPGVKHAAVFGVPDPRMMEAGFAVLVTDPSAAGNPDAEAVRRHCAERLASYKIPKYVEFIEGDLPRNDLGKVLKTRLRDEALCRLGAVPAQI